VYEGEMRTTSSRPIRTVNFLNETRKYELFYINEFDSNRKRMSVIVRCLQTDQFILLCKGAENAVFNKCANKDYVVKSNEYIMDFAQNGWRTLALAYRVLSKQEFDSFDLSLTNAYNDLNNRDEKLSELYELIESDMTLIASTAVEDRLQEHVASTLETLRVAGIKIWVLTGDKKETAISISDSCKHFSSYMQKLILTDLKDENQIRINLKLHHKM
jgi:phospholipid-translocating ATPase